MIPTGVISTASYTPAPSTTSSIPPGARPPPPAPILSIHDNNRIVSYLLFLLLLQGPRIQHKNSQQNGKPNYRNG
jgi:hypothetical protein